MDNLIITVTVDSTVSYPGNHLCPPQKELDRVAAEYIHAVNAGASITHIHGVRSLEREIQSDGRQVSKLDFAGWKGLQERIKASCNPVMQFGVASARIEEKVNLMNLKPDMMSIAFNAHDEFFQPDPRYPPNEMYASHPRDELAAYGRAAIEHGVKIEVESFQTGAFWNMEFISDQGLLPEPIWTTLLVGWKGGCWTPPTPKALISMVEHLPTTLKINWNLSVMDSPTHWQLLTLAIILGGHVRVGWEDNPYLPDGVLAETNAVLVEKIVRIARELGREIASPDEARQIIGIA